MLRHNYQERESCSVDSGTSRWHFTGKLSSNKRRNTINNKLSSSYISFSPSLIFGSPSPSKIASRGRTSRSSMARLRNRSSSGVGGPDKSSVRNRFFMGWGWSELTKSQDHDVDCHADADEGEGGGGGRGRGRGRGRE
eukprot:756418-Hanusia_phi.AAC.1